MLIKTEDTDFLRDDCSKALINTNVNAFKQYKLARANRKLSSENDQKIKELEAEVTELKTLVRELLKEKNV
jgi:hypothetical protein